MFVMNENFDVIIFDDEELSRTLIENYLGDFSFIVNILKFSEFEEDLIPCDNCYKIIIVNINKTNTKNLEKLSKISHNKYNNVIVISYEKSADIQVKALRSGAVDFLSKPLIKSEFINALQNVINKINNKKDNKMSNSKVFSVISAASSVGKTFFALNLAKELATISNKKVLLLDFNNSLTDVFQMLNIDPHYNTLQYLNLMDEENADEMLSRLVKLKNIPMFILGTGMCSNTQLACHSEKINSFMDILKHKFDYIIVDTDPSLSDIEDYYKSNSDGIYLIMDTVIATAETIAEHHVDYRLESKELYIILNKYNEKKDEGAIAEIERILGRQIHMAIPKNYVAASTAVTKGVTLDQINPQSEIVKKYIELAKEIINRDNQ